MDRSEMITMLHELDTELKTVLEIEICGSSCAILNHGLERASADIDVMRSSIPFEDQNLHQAIYSVALHKGSDAHGYSFLKGRDIAEYAMKRFGIKVSIHEETVWQESIDNLTVKPGALIAKVDLHAAKFIGKNELDVSEFDRTFRKIREKSKDHDFDL
jgi:hypothetical protein